MPIHCKAVVALTIVLAASAPASAQTMPSESPRAIESFVAPPALFPPESSYDGKVPPDLPAFDRANGRRVGSIALARPECIAMAQDRQEAVGCTYPLGFVYKTTDALQAYPVPVKEWSYETLGFPSYRASIFQGHETWSEVQHAGGAVWVKTAAKDVHPFEELAYLVPNIAMLCTQPGEHCHPVLPAHHREIARVATLTGTCYNSPYTVVDRVTKRSKRYYKLDIENWQGKSFLPRPIYVPTRNADGSHAGEFFARGC